MLRHVAIISALAAAANGVFWFPSTAADEAPYVLKSDVRLVLLDVSVKDHAGLFVPSLLKDNFSVYENGRQQKITVFTNHELPATIGLLVDASYSMTPKRDEVLKAAEMFIRESNPRDEMFVLTFNDKVRAGLPEGTPFSSDRKQLHDALYRGRPAGKTALNDAVIAGLEQLKHGTRDRRTLVLISDGGDNASVHHRPELLRLAEENVATIYTIGLYETDSRDRDPTLLRKLARISGGEAYFPTEPEQMEDVCTRIAKDIRERYTVGYAPAEPGASGTSELRQIRLRVLGPGNIKLAARARSSYRYDHSLQNQQESKHIAQ